MQREKLELTEEDGYAALREHVRDRALAARARYGPTFEPESLRRMLQDPEVVRFPTRIAFDAQALLPGEFGFASATGERPSEGFTLFMHPCFESRPELWPELVAYHVVSINYLDIATHVEAELFGATLLGMDVDAYYARICALADAVPGAPPPEATTLPDESELHGADAGADVGAGAAAGGGCGSGSCACKGAS